MPTPQNYKNHTRFDPPFHYVIIPILLLNFIFSIYIAIHSGHAYLHTHLWYIVMSFVFILMAGNARASALKAQDRIIRLEERLRLASILPASDSATIAQLTEAQLIALRFAPDEELAALAHKAVSQGLERKAIKKNIVNWRADNFRV